MSVWTKPRRVVERRKDGRVESIVYIGLGGKLPALGSGAALSLRN
jgi:hypothetical protein